MNRSYRVTIHSRNSHSFVMARSAKEASEIAAKAVNDGEQVTIEDPDHRVLTVDDLADIIRTGGDS